MKSKLISLTKTKVLTMAYKALHYLASDGVSDFLSFFPAPVSLGFTTLASLPLPQLYSLAPDICISTSLLQGLAQTLPSFSVKPALITLCKTTIHILLYFIL